MLKSIIDVLFEARCLGCHNGRRSRLGLCDQCLERVQFQGAAGCIRCGRSVHRFGCVPDSHSYRRVLSLAAYVGPWRQVVLAVKAGRDQEAAWALVGELTALIKSLDVKLPQLVVPVPGSGRQWRRFDGVILLARELAAAFGLEYANCLQRLPGRGPQVALSRQERLRGLESYITVTAGHYPAGTIWLVDDVFTTGGTAAACSKALLRAGADGVIVLTMAN